MLLSIAILFLVCVVLPLAQAWRLLRLREPTRLAWLLVAADATVVVIVLFLVGRWDIAGYWLRPVLATLFASALLRSWWNQRGRPWRSGAGRPLCRGHKGTIASLAIFGAILLHALSGLSPSAPARDLVFPLAGGRFVVGQGGDAWLLNHHARNVEQRHAADIVALNRFGFRASGLLPQGLDAFAIHGATVRSPCEGKVVSARDDLPDLAPGEMDPANPAGNHVLLECDGLRVMLAHLQRASLLVERGDSLAAGNPVGRVGNSGNTTEPHLHVHAFDPRTGDVSRSVSTGECPCATGCS
ncbi:MAG: M23 family metallopeptidase [Burkholderiaceae bacterium]